MANGQVAQVDKGNGINSLSNDDWLKRAVSFRVNPEQKELFLEDYALAKKLRALAYEAGGPEAVTAFFGSLVPAVKMNPRSQVDSLAMKHPCPFDERDIADLIELLTKTGGKVLDPFAGTSTTLCACYKTGRIGGGIELYQQWIEVSKERLSRLMGKPYENGLGKQFLRQGNALALMPSFRPDNVDLVITSPPYFSFFKRGKGERRERRLRQGLAIDYGDSPSDIGGTMDFKEHLRLLKAVYSECYRILKVKAFMALIVHDINVGGSFMPYHTYMIRLAEMVGFKLVGIQIILDDWRKPADYGIPWRFFLNFTHHYALVFQKPTGGPIVL
jgi:DNA modification methylase